MKSDEIYILDLESGVSFAFSRQDLRSGENIDASPNMRVGYTRADQLRAAIFFSNPDQVQNVNREAMEFARIITRIETLGTVSPNPETFEILVRYLAQLTPNPEETEKNLLLPDGARTWTASRWIQEFRNR